MIEEVGLLPYSERLQILQLTTLAERRSRGDLIEVYKASQGLSQLTEKSNLLSNALEVNSNAIRQDLADLRKTIDSQMSVKTDTASITDSNNDCFKNLEDVILDINNQLQNINLHVCSAKSIDPRTPLIDEELLDDNATTTECQALTPNTMSHHFPQNPILTSHCDPYEIRAM
ncbi:hypothetical protein ACHWQZ_G009124 [Mnemiopsis leidyi]